MKRHLTFTDADFENLRKFEKAVERQIGNHVYVGTDSMCLYFDYPKDLVKMLRPMPENKVYEFDLESSKPDAK